MNFLKMLVAVLGVFAAAAPLRADPLSACYKSAENRVQVRQCLQQEFDRTTQEYQKLLGEVRAQMPVPATVSAGKKKTAKPRAPLTEANEAFDNYMRQECALEASLYGDGTSAGNQQLACKINLMRLRMGALSGLLSDTGFGRK